MSIVLVIIALITGSGLMMGSSMLDSAKIANTNNKLNTIETSLMAYRMAYNRIPCPADLTLSSSSSNFGIEAAVAGTCTGSSPAANSSAIISGATGQVAEGGVPTKALGLPDEFMVDGWGRKFAYAVWAPLTSIGGFTSYVLNPLCGAIKVKNAGGNTRSTKGDYLLISYGPDGHGGYIPGSTTPYNAGSTNVDEQANAHFNTAGAPTTYLATYVQKDWTQNPADTKDNFDDIVRYKERWQMMTDDDKWSPNGTVYCTPGFIIQGALTNGNLLGSQYHLIATADINNDGYPDLILGATGAWSAQHGNIYVIFGQKGGFANPFPVSGLNGTNGFVITGLYGEATNPMAVGDINGDGIPDIVVYDSLAVNPTGYIYVIFGGAGTWPASFNVSALAGSTGVNGTNGLKMVPPAYPCWTCPWGADLQVGDVDKDGYADIVYSIQQPTAGYSAGQVDVIFGHANPWAASVTPAFDGTDGFKITQSRCASASASFAEEVAVGDLNGDGYADIVTMDGTYGELAGQGGYQADVIFGHAKPWSASYDVSTMFDGTQATKLSHSQGMANVGGIDYAFMDFTGHGNGIQDLVVRNNDHNSAERTYVLFGHVNPWAASIDLSTLSGPGGTGLIFNGTGSQHAGWNYVGCDMNQDGIQDLVIDAPQNAPGGVSNAGSVFVIYGKNTSITPWGATTYTISTLMDGTNGFEIDGVNTNEYDGRNLGCLDMTGDGKKELVINASSTSPNGITNAGSTYVIYGKSTVWTSPFSLQTLQ